MTTRFQIGLISALAMTATGIGGVALVPTTAKAQSAAQVESQTRPNFGVLLSPPTRSGRTRPRARYDYGRHRPDYNRPGAVYRPGGEEVVLVDCGGNPGSGAVEDAVRRVRPGGTLVIRAKAGPCVGWLNIDKPLTIIGEGGFDPRDWGKAIGSPTLQAPDGLPCLSVSANVRVEIRDVIFASPNGGDAACIVSYGGEITMNRVGFRHSGDEAAIYADGGRIDMRNVVMEAQTIAPAIVADGAVFNAYELLVSGPQSGIELTPGSGETSRISTTTFKGTGASNNFGPRSIGVTVRSARDYGRVEIENTAIVGFVEGVAIEGASVDIKNSRIGRSDKGVVLYNGELRLENSRVRATSVGVAAASGSAVVLNNVFAGVQEVVYAEYRANVQVNGNRVWSQSLCRPQFRDRYSGRYEPVWRPAQGYQCMYGSYPRDWWEDEDGLLGLEYQDDGYALDGYDRYQRGDGWYDRDGRYVQDNRYRGDDRWNRGGGRRR